MSKLLVNTPPGKQEVIDIRTGGGYFDASRVLWDERIDGAIPAITLGAMKRIGGALVYEAALDAATIAANQANAALQARTAAKATRTAAVEAIAVTTTAGHTFDGDETSQTRMVRAIVALNATATPSIKWVLANNTVIQATSAELTEALALAGAAQAAVWVL